MSAKVGRKPISYKIRNIKVREVLTTGQVAKICNVAPRTVSKWCDTGVLDHYRIPGSNDRRVKLDSLRAFMLKHNIDYPLELEDNLFVFSEANVGQQLAPCIAPATAFDAGVAVGETVYTAAVVDDFYGYSVAEGICRKLHTDNPRCIILLLVDPSTPLENFKSWPVRAMHKPVSIEVIRAVIGR